MPIEQFQRSFGMNNAQNWNLRYTRRSSLSDGWYSTSKGQIKDNEKIPFSAYVYASLFCALLYAVMVLGDAAGF